MTFKLHLPSPALQVPSCLYTAISASVVVGQSAGHPLAIPVVGPTPATSQTPVPCAADISAAHTPTLQSALPTASPPRFSARRLPSSPWTSLQVHRRLAQSLLPCLPQRSTTGCQVAWTGLVAGRAVTQVPLGSRHQLGRGRMGSRRPRPFCPP